MFFLDGAEENVYNKNTGCSYYNDDDTGLYYCNARYYSSLWRRFISPDDTTYLAPGYVNGLNLYCYCGNDPVNTFNKSAYQLFSGGKGEASLPPLGLSPSENAELGMPEWAKWLIGGLAVAGLVVATAMTFGAAGTIVGTVGASMLAGGLVSGGMSAVGQLCTRGTVDWTSVAISTLSGIAYGAVVGVTGGAWSTGAFVTKALIAGGTSALESWNQNQTGAEIRYAALKGMANSMLVQWGAQAYGMPVWQYIVRKWSEWHPRNPDVWLTMGDIASVMWEIPAIKTAALKLLSGIKDFTD